MTAPLSERATFKIGRYECGAPYGHLRVACPIDHQGRYKWFRRASPPDRTGTKYVCRVCDSRTNLLSRGGRFSHVLRDLRAYGIEGCWERISRRSLTARVDHHRRRGQFYHQAPQGIAYAVVSGTETIGDGHR